MFTFPVTFFGGGGPRRVFTALPAAQLSASSFSFTSTALGDEATGRLIVVGVTMETTGTLFSFSSVTVAGNTATSVVERAQTDTLQKTRIALYQVSLSTGTSGTIVATFGGSVSRCQVGVWAVYDLVSHTVNTTNNAGANDGSTASYTINIPATGIMLTLACMFGGTATQTLTGAGTIDGSDGAVTGARQWASYQAGGAETGRAVSFSGSGGADSARALVGATWA